MLSMISVPAGWVLLAGRPWLAGRKLINYFRIPETHFLPGTEKTLHVERNQFPTSEFVPDTPPHSFLRFPRCCILQSEQLLPTVPPGSGFAEFSVCLTTWVEQLFAFRSAAGGP